MDRSSFQYVLERLSPELQFIDKREKLTFLYLTNEEGLEATELEPLGKTIISQLSLYVNLLKHTQNDINSITVPIDNSGRVDLIIIIRNKELKGVNINDTTDFDNLVYTLSKKDYPINYFVRENGAQNRRPTELTITKEFEGVKSEILSYLDMQLRNIRREAIAD